MNVGKEIALEAKKKNICKEWFSEMTKQSDIKKLCEMYFKGDDWSMKNDFPSLDILRKFKGNSDQFGLHTDFNGLLKDKKNTALFGESEVTIDYSGYFAGTLIIRHDSKAKIQISENAYLVINLLDNAFVEIEATDHAKVHVFQYGKNSNFKITGNVEVIKKEWK